MTVYLPLDWCIFTEIFNTKGRFWTSLRNSCLSVIKIVLDSMLYETLKWPQIAPFCISSKKKFRWGADPDPLPFKIMACTLLSLSYASIMDLTLANGSLTWRCVAEPLNICDVCMSRPQLMPSTLQIQYCYFYSNARQKYFYLGLRNGLKISKNKMPRNIVDYFWHINVIKTRDVIWNLLAYNVNTGR
jgi:hypothetical protein